MLQMINQYRTAIVQTQMYACSSVKNEIYPQGANYMVSTTGVPIIHAPNAVPICYTHYQGTQMHLPITNHQRIGYIRANSQLLEANEPPLIPSYYSDCNFLAQLEGSWQVNGPDGEILRIVVTTEGDEEYAIVRRLGAGEDRILYDEETRFTLCSLNDDVEAVAMKGVGNMHTLTWYKNDGKSTFWGRVYKPVTTDGLTFVSEAPEFSQASLLNHKEVSPSEVPPNEGVRTRAGVCESNEEPVRELSSSSQVSSSCNSVDENSPDSDLFCLLQDLCKDPIVLQKILHWGISRTNRIVGDKEIAELGSGRFWVNARLFQCCKRDAHRLQEILKELTGAYQESTPGMYLQPEPKWKEPGIRHRLRRSSFGFWVIDKYDVEQDVWRPYTQELSNGQWVDSTNGLNLFTIQIVPMLDILNRMKGDWLEYGEMKERIEFLFNSCNQKKLITKLKPRSLKHHIVNLRVKLEKQYSLSFAVRVAKIAESIALEELKLRKT